MIIKEIIYALFYFIAFGFAILSGLKYGFTDSHTPPMPFLIGLLTMVIGGILFSIDYLINKLLNKNISYKVHLIGLTLNGLLLFYVIIIALF